MTLLSSQALLDFADVFPGRIPVSPRTGRRLIARGEIGIVRVAGRAFIPESSLEEYLQRNFTPAVVRRSPAPVEIGLILDRHIPRKRRTG